MWARPSSQTPGNGFSVVTQSPPQRVSRLRPLERFAASSRGSAPFHCGMSPPPVPSRNISSSDLKPVRSLGRLLQNFSPLTVGPCLHYRVLSTKGAMITSLLHVPTALPLPAERVHLWCSTVDSESSALWVAVPPCYSAPLAARTCGQAGASQRVMGVGSTSHGALFSVPASHAVPTAFHGIFQRPLFPVRPPSLCERMDPARLSTAVNAAWLVRQYVTSSQSGQVSELPERLGAMGRNTSFLLTSRGSCTWRSVALGLGKRALSVTSRPVWDDESRLQNVRMWEASFLDLCAELTPALRRKDTQMRIASRGEVPGDCCVDAGDSRLLLVSWNQLGEGKSTGGVPLTQVHRAINCISLRRTVTLGNERETTDRLCDNGIL
ncbi:uncharacterized protein LOC119846910 [Dermochelys coriacea]|uniref:uncharacterized protein LOC119846910 n=1 Tax=Dermochelys coriacea TaxID=27794 RepID=UPI0018E78BDD|nr:uncharacterized protein LOC119846910 [Dermochelys coriacea]